MKVFYIPDPAKEKERKRLKVMSCSIEQRVLGLAEPLKEMPSFLKVGIN